LIGSMTRAAARTRFELPEPGTAASAPTEPVEGLVTDPLVQPPRRPDIVILLAESFFEPGILVDIEPCQSLPDWCALADRGLSGTLVVPTYGGNTTRTEFELLTGVPFATFGGLDYVYLSVVTRPLYSIPWMLRDQGYETVAIHNHMGFFWNRNEALPRLGFEKYVSVEQMEGVKELGFYARDDVLTGELLDVLDSGGRSAPMMAFVITMENHGPWNANRRGRLPAEVSDIDVPEVVAGLEGEPLQQYLFHAGRFVDQVTAIWDVLAQRERDTLLVVFGDHLPGMATVFDRLGFDDGLLAPQQPTPYVVLANYDLPGTPPTHLPVHQLLPQALHAAGLELGELYGELQAVYRVVPNGDPAIAERRDQRISHLQWRVLGEPVTAGQSSAD
jgi:hypothetical protein